MHSAQNEDGEQAIAAHYLAVQARLCSTGTTDFEDVLWPQPIRMGSL
jgi:hypothetical protein